MTTINLPLPPGPSPPVGAGALLVIQLCLRSTPPIYFCLNNGLIIVFHYITRAHFCVFAHRNIILLILAAWEFLTTVRQVDT